VKPCCNLAYGQALVDVKHWAKKKGLTQVAEKMEAVLNKEETLNDYD
jgi:hypothetical protein